MTVSYLASGTGVLSQSPSAIPHVRVHTDGLKALKYYEFGLFKRILPGFYLEMPLFAFVVSLNFQFSCLSPDFINLIKSIALNSHQKFSEINAVDHLVSESPTSPQRA
jgi:hypothetical protein